MILLVIPSFHWWHRLGSEQLLLLLRLLCLSSCLYTGVYVICNVRDCAKYSAVKKLVPYEEYSLLMNVMLMINSNIIQKMNK